MSKIKLSVNHKEVLRTDGRPELIKGGDILSLGNGFYYVKGKKPNKTDDVDVDIINSKQGVEVFSDEDMLGGKSPADLVLEGADPNQVFAAQEQYKQIHGINDDGTKKAKGGLIEKLKSLFNIKNNDEDISTDEDKTNKKIKYKDTINFNYNGENIPINKKDLERISDVMLFSKSADLKNKFETAIQVNTNVSRNEWSNIFDDMNDDRYQIVSIDKDNKLIKELDKNEYLQTLKKPKYKYLSTTNTDGTINSLKSIGYYDYIKELSDVYGVDPNLIARRFVKEGVFSMLLNDYNYFRTPIEQDDKNIRNLYDTFKYGSFEKFGLDMFKYMYDKGKILIKNKELDDYLKTVQTNKQVNEKGQPVEDFMINPSNGLELYAAYFKYLKDKYPNDSSTKLNARFNLGEYHKDLNNEEWINKTYGFEPYYEYNKTSKKRFGGMSKKSKDAFMDSLMKSINGLNKIKLNNTNSDNMSPIDLQILDRELNKDVLLGHTHSTGVQSKKCGGRVKAVMGTDGKDYTSVDKMPFGVFPAEANYNESGNKYNEDDITRGKRAVNAMHWLTYGLGAGGDMLSAIIGSSIEHGTTNKAINKIKELIGKVKSYNLALPNYNTHVEVEPQLAENRRTSAYLRRNIDADISDSQKALDMKRKVKDNELYKNMLIQQYKVNEQNRLRNFKTKEQYNIINENIRNATNIENQKLSMLMGIVDKQSENDANLTRNIVGGINSGIRTLLTGLNQKEQMMIAGIDSPEGDNATYGTIGKRIREREEEKERKRKERENKRKAKNNKFNPFEQNDLLIG